MIKTFLMPKTLRRGSPVVTFITKDRGVCDLRKNNYTLGTYHNISSCDNPPYKGNGSEYQGVQRIPISKETYEALLKEAKDKHKRMGE